MSLNSPAVPIRLTSALVAFLLAVAACSGSSDEDAAADETDPAVSTTEPGGTEPGGDDPDAAAPVAEGYPAQPDGVPFPSDEWPEGELPEGADEAAIVAATEAAFSGGDDAGEGEVSSIVVVQGGEIVYEAYNPAFDADHVFDSWSVAKTFTAAFAGLVVDDGLLAVDDAALRPEWPEGDPRAEITLEDLLQMASGLAWIEGAQYGEFFDSTDASAYMASRDLVAEPGTQFNYATPGTALLARIAADEVGGCEDAEAYFQERMLDPIGITSELFLRDNAGCWFGGLGLNMTTRDFARFGLLLVRGGVWEGEQLLSTEWVDAMREPSPASEAYGYQTWLIDGGEAFAARGLGGQTILVVPDDDIVIAVNNRSADSCGLVGTVLDELGSDLDAC